MHVKLSPGVPLVPSELETLEGTGHSQCCLERPTGMHACMLCASSTINSLPCYNSSSLWEAVK